MRQLCLSAAVLLLAGSVSAVRAEEKVEVKGVHLCCNACVKSVANILSKVEGVSGAKCERATKTVTFTAKDAETASKAFDSLAKGGFYGTAVIAGKERQLKLNAPTAKEKEVIVMDVHVCCKACQNAISKLFPGTTITYSGKGAQRNVTIAGDDLSPAAVLQTLRKAGFNGEIGKR